MQKPYDNRGATIRDSAIRPKHAIRLRFTIWQPIKKKKLCTSTVAADDVSATRVRPVTTRAPARAGETDAQVDAGHVDCPSKYEDKGKTP
jgi:hypothetical protein